MRADNQATWAWDDNASRNPAIQLLWYLLGWRINGRLAVGKGIPPARIDLASFITAANLCDEPVALAGGGTQPRYRSDGLFSEGDATSTVLDQLKAAMNAELDDVDGKIRITVLHNDLATPVADFTEDDILGAFTWDQTAPLDETYNVVRGTFVDPSSTSLYQPIDYPEFRMASPDGIDRVETVDFQTVQDARQAQRLVKQRIARMLYSGRFTATFGYRAWKVQKNDVVRLTFAPLGWTNKLFRVLETSVQVDGQVPMVLQVEHPDIYLWDREEAPPVQPVEPTRYDPYLNPLVGGISDAAGTAVWANVEGEGRPDDYATRNRYRGIYSNTETYYPGDNVLWDVATGGDGRGYGRIGEGQSGGIPPSDPGRWAVVVDRGQGGAGGGSLLRVGLSFTEEIPVGGDNSDENIIASADITVPAGGTFSVTGLLTSATGGENSSIALLRLKAGGTTIASGQVTISSTGIITSDPIAKWGGDVFGNPTSGATQVTLTMQRGGSSIQGGAFISGSLRVEYLAD